MLDTEATHNFISEDEVTRLGLKVTKCGRTIKAVNSLAKPFVRTAQGVHVMLGTWNRKLDFLIMLMDDFTMILGIEFFDRV